MEKAYQLWKVFQDRFMAPITAILFLGPIILGCVEVIRRYFFGESWDWQQDMVTYLILSATYLFFPITQRKDMHLHVDLFIILAKKRSPALSHAMKLFAQLASVVYLGYFTYYGMKMTYNTYVSGRLVLSQVMVFWPFFLILTLGMGFMLITFLFQIYREIQEMRGKTVLVEEADGALSTD
ncbi:MAG: TRAP transporter small permease [Deltaproteobacteria bacterium]|nr:TRAP transporter small permease [Deltaproteobacteria bacterium]